MTENLLKGMMKTLAIVISILLIANVATRGSVQSDIPPPPGSGAFGTFVAILPSGNIIVTDPLFDAPGPVANVGAVHLFNGDTLALIASLTGSLAEDRVGSDGVVVLPNGNYVVSSTLWGTNDVGAVTFCDMTAGCNGTVSAANSLVGGLTNDNVGNLPVTILSDGDFVVRSTNWDRPSPTVSNVGATTFCSGTSGCPTGLVTAANSFIGSTASDFIGNGGITVLNNGGFVVRSSVWDNTSPVLVNAGAVTFCNGTTGCTGAVSGVNSLIGTTASDQVGSSGLTALADGDFVVSSPNWDNNVAVVADVGAATFCNGTTGCTGTISSTNSLVGTITNDRVAGSSVKELANGNYIVVSAGWDNPAPLTVNAGAATWCSGTSGCTGAVTSSNSLFGSTDGDLSGTLITALPNGNYVVRSIVWDNGAATNAGAATFCIGTGGCTGAISATNSLVGSTTNDNVSSGGITFLDNSRYAVSSPNWDNGATVDVGMVAFCDGTAGCLGVPGLTDSKRGISTASPSQFPHKTGAVSGDRLSSRGIVPVNGAFGSAFVSSSPDADIGGRPNSGIVAIHRETGFNGPISEADGLYGPLADDRVGFNGSAVLTSTNKIVAISSKWNNEKGAVTVLNVNDPSSMGQAVTTFNSYTGNLQFVCLGATDCTGTLASFAILPNGHVVVGCPKCLNGAGSFALLNRRNNYLMGMNPSDATGVVGNATDDMLGATIITHENSNYFLRFPRLNNGMATDSGGFVHGAGYAGTTGPVTSANAIVGNVQRMVLNESVANSGEFGWNVVGFPDQNRVAVNRTLFRTTKSGDFEDSTTYDLNSVPIKTDNLFVRDGDTVTINTIGEVNSVDVDCTGNLVGGSSTSFFVSYVTKNYCSGGTFTYPIGTNDAGIEYSPFQANVTNLATNPSSLTAAVFKGAVQGIPPVDQSNHLDRNWFLFETGDLTADLEFNYLQSDVRGDEARYVPLFDEFGEVLYFQCFRDGCTEIVDRQGNTVAVSGRSRFSNWSAGIPGEDLSISGRVVNSSGRGVSNARLRSTNQLGITQTAVTGSFGFFRFSRIVTGEIHSIEVRHKRYAFSSREIEVMGNVSDFNFIGIEN